MTNPQSITTTYSSVSVLIILGVVSGGSCLEILPRGREFRLFVNDPFQAACFWTNFSSNTPTKDIDLQWYRSFRNEWILPLAHRRVSTKQIFHGVLLNFQSVQRHDRGIYSCVSPTQVESIVLHVFDKITLDRSLSEQWADEGANYTMQCQTVFGTGGNARVFSWTINDNIPLPPKYEATSYGLVINHVTPDDADKTYKCRVTDLEPSTPQTVMVQMTITLHVRPRPETVTNVPRHVTIIPAVSNVEKEVRESYSVICLARDGSEDAKWIGPNNATIKAQQSRNARVYTDINFGVDLYLTNITKADAGTYTCVTPNGFSSFHLNVIDKKAFSEKSSGKLLHPEGPLKFWAVLGQWVNLTCTVKSEFPASFMWKRNDKLLDQDEKIYIFRSENNKSTLSIYMSDDSKYGNYTCIASNDQKTIDIEMEVVKAYLPSIPLLDVESVHENDISFRIFLRKSDYMPATAAEQLPITGYHFEYKLISDKEWKVVPTVAKLQDKVYKVEDMNADTLYQFRVAAMNIATRGNFSRPLTVTTLPKLI